MCQYGIWKQELSDPLSSEFIHEKSKHLFTVPKMACYKDIYSAFLWLYETNRPIT
jgi:hypothetical protein